MGTLLLRGMLVGLVAGILCFIFLRTVGEPHVDRAIAFEAAESAAAASPDVATPAITESHDHAAQPAGHSHGDEEMVLVSRSTQAGLGLITATTIYGAALGGLFSLAFAFVYGYWERLGPRSTAAVLAVVGFVAIYLVPFFKYPPNPPAVGNPDTIGIRTGLYVAMLAISLAGMIVAINLRGRLAPAHGRWNAALLAGAAYLVAMMVVGLLMPGINEVPETFPATTLWAFRIASIGGQAILWSVIGIGFGLLTHRVASRERGARLDAAVV